MTYYQCLSGATCDAYMKHGIVCRVCKESADRTADSMRTRAIDEARRLLEGSGYVVTKKEASP